METDAAKRATTYTRRNALKPYRRHLAEPHVHTDTHFSQREPQPHFLRAAEQQRDFIRPLHIPDSLPLARLVGEPRDGDNHR